MTKFERRITAPKSDNKYYYSNSNMFYPNYTDNCTWYAWGRQLELGVKATELKKNMPTSNAENWYNETKYEKSQTPKVGDIGCYKGGEKYHKASDGAGHVFVVEEVFSDGSIRISESGTNMKFQSRIIKPPYKYYLSTKYNYSFEGFIHIQDYEEEENTWELGDYKILYNKYLRYSPKVASNNKCKYKNLSATAKTKCIKDNLGYSKYKVGAKVNIKEFQYDVKGNLWGRTNTLWVCVNDSTGKQAERV